MVVVYGEVKGNIQAGQKVILKKPGHVYGLISAQRVSTENGAILKGSIKMGPQDLEKCFQYQCFDCYIGTSSCR